jgi:acetoin utilization protein AcuB
MKIAKLMTTKLLTVSPDDSVEGAVRMLQQRGVRHLLVLDGHDLVGILSDRDIKRALDFSKRKHKKLLNLGGLFFLLEPILVREIMTKDPVSIAPSATAQEAAEVMVSRRFGALPVVKAGKLVGIVTESDLLRYFAGADGRAGAKQA